MYKYTHVGQLNRRYPADKLWVSPFYSASFNGQTPCLPHECQGKTVNPIPCCSAASPLWLLYGSLAHRGAAALLSSDFTSCSSWARTRGTP